MADIDENGFRAAINSDIDDFEDAVQYVISQKANCTLFITRNKSDFANKPDVFDPAEFIDKLKTSNAS